MRLIIIFLLLRFVKLLDLCDMVKENKPWHSQVLKTIKIVAKLHCGIKPLNEHTRVVILFLRVLSFAVVPRGRKSVVDATRESQPLDGQLFSAA